MTIALDATYSLGDRLSGGNVAIALLGNTLATGAGLVVLITILGPLSGAHFNPALTIALAVIGKFAWVKVPGYIIAQVAGGMLGAFLVWLAYLPHWKETLPAETKLTIFCTAPAIRSAGANLLSEAIGSFVLVMVVGAIFSKTVAPGGPAAGLGPYLVGALVWGIGLSLGGTTGYAINPARDLGPRIAHALLPVAKKGGSDWGYAAVPVLGPLVGGALAGVFIKMAHF